MKIISVKKYKQLEKQLFNHNEPNGCSSHEADDFLTLFDEYTTSQTFWQFLATPYYKIRNCHLFSKIKYAFQRMINGYSDEDICEIDTWFLRVVPKMLREFKENCDEELFNTVIFCNRHPEDYACKSPEQIYVEQEILRELYAGLDRIGRREQAYLLYRYGFTDDIEHIFLENGTQTVKMQFDTIPQKIQNRCTFHPCEDEKYSGFFFCRNNIFKKDLRQISAFVYDITAVSR